MELKTKYQYTYFLKPFVIKEQKYEKYIYSLLQNKNYNYKFFEKEKDLELYSYFLQNAREYLFPTFSYTKGNIKELNNMNNNLKASILSKLHCNVFEYNLPINAQGKVNYDDSGIFFNINKIEIICFDTGICFLVIRTNVENTDNFLELLDFNYKFQEINSEFTKLKNFDNIKIQTDKFSSITELSKFIQNIIGAKNKFTELEDIDIYNQKFFVYTYACIDENNLYKEKDFQNITNEVVKCIKVLPSSNTMDFNKDEVNKDIQTVSQFKYSKFGFSKQSAAFISSSADINNYTKLLFEYETIYFYTLIIALYQRIYLTRTNIQCKNKADIDETRKNFTKFTKEIWLTEITNSTTGTVFYEKWKNVFELDKVYDEIKNKYDTIYKESNIENTNKINKIILGALIVSIILNIINLIILLKM